MMLLTFLKLVVGQLDDPYRVEAERMRRLTASRAEDARDDRYDDLPESEETPDWSPLSLDGRKFDRPNEELAWVSLTTPDANAGEKPDPDRWM